METKIYYYRDHIAIYVALHITFSRGIPVDFKDYFHDTNYACVYEIPHVKTNTEVEKYKYFESLFQLFNSEENPLSLKQEMIGKNHTHTSMSVGDIISYEGEFYLITGNGFKLI
jgi:hypothetical protein